MRSAGIDIGSRTIKVVVVEDDRVVAAEKRENSFDPLGVCHELLDGLSYDVIVATGYGRHLFAGAGSCRVASELSAFARGARALCSSCRTVLDMGGQDTKVIALTEAGAMLKFEMNDRCAAGTGRFLEVMAMALGYSLDDFPAAALGGKRAEAVSSMCTVFAESEVISLISRGSARPDLALGIHESIARRTAAMLKKIPLESDVVFAGGVARNPCMAKLISEAIGRPLFVPEDPQIVGALGCALIGCDEAAIVA